MKYVNRDEIIKAVKEAMCPMDYPSELRDSIARTIVSAAESIDVVRCKVCKYSIEVKESDDIICRHPSQHATYERTNDDYLLNVAFAVMLHIMEGANLN